MGERWGDSQRDRDALDRWITRDDNDVESDIYEGQRRRFKTADEAHTITLIHEHEGVVQYEYDDGRDGACAIDTYEAATIPEEDG